jgi:hypothetical protein
VKEGDEANPRHFSFRPGNRIAPAHAGPILNLIDASYQQENEPSQPGDDADHDMG